MKQMKRLMNIALVLFVALAMSACGGGGGGTPAHVETETHNVGVITALGSVFVNGVEFNTAGAAVKIDDTISPATALKPGMVVRVRGVVDDNTMTGRAIEIEARDALEGTVDAVGVNNTITVMGQTVHVEDNITRLNDDNPLIKTFADAAFAVGERVEVHAFPDDSTGVVGGPVGGLGGLRASRVVKKAAGEFEMKGFVVNPLAGSFGLSLTPGGASVLNVTGTLPAGAGDGSFVQVKSVATPAAGAPPTITASDVKLENDIAPAGQKVRVEGLVTSGNVNDFVVNGKRVLTNGQTLFVGGLKNEFQAAMIGMKIEAEGPLDLTGAIVATKISFRSNIRLEADVTALTPGTSLTLMGKAVAINQYTRIDQNAGPLNLGSHVEVRAFVNRDNALVADRITVKGASAKVFLQGTVNTVGAGTMTIMDITANTDALTTIFRVSNDALPTEPSVAPGVFFAQLRAKITVVKVRWADNATFVGGGAVEEAEIEIGK